MKKIYKYSLPYDGDTITIPYNIIRFLEIHTQNGIPTIWVIVDPDDEATISTEIIAIGTGWELQDGLGDYLGTAEDEFGYVWHYFVYEPKEMLKASTEEEEQVILIDGFAALAQSLGKIGVSAEKAVKNMEGLFDARI